MQKYFLLFEHFLIPKNNNIPIQKYGKIHKNTFEYVKDVLFFLIYISHSIERTKTDVFKNIMSVMVMLCGRVGVDFKATPMCKWGPMYSGVECGCWFGSGLVLIWMLQRWVQKNVGVEDPWKTGLIELSECMILATVLEYKAVPSKHLAPREETIPL